MIQHYNYDTTFTTQNHIIDSGHMTKKMYKNEKKIDWQIHKSIEHILCSNEHWVTHKFRMRNGNDMVQQIDDNRTVHGKNKTSLCTEFEPRVWNRISI